MRRGVRRTFCCCWSGGVSRCRVVSGSASWGVGTLMCWGSGSRGRSRLGRWRRFSGPRRASEPLGRRPFLLPVGDRAELEGGGRALRGRAAGRAEDILLLLERRGVRCRVVSGSASWGVGTLMCWGSGSRGRSRLGRWRRFSGRGRASEPLGRRPFLLPVGDRAELEGGRAGGRAEDILLLLERRGVPVSGGERERIVGCGDLDVLGVWFTRAITAGSVAEVFEPAEG
ncbi:hypothetical protein SAM23877_4483 [Streptomyces ambofaciens ATCC 23877]|uniref:Uncharacterized protein n=1 Tax=Streptomyces ambofaciens (strain ATCC 23877 / 3486 / DSM 40053 / JCM 4204 / NBRC 12836 / NRRL B-2516) TaxID=278992 RepID=A0A0K2AX34_STRA7|nr:hypothetical protein SAM23877_4483 [Streptomyces ambofaciens ATCC 23877]